MLGGNFCEARARHGRCKRAVPFQGRRGTARFPDPSGGRPVGGLGCPCEPPVGRRGAGGIGWGRAGRGRGAPGTSAADRCRHGELARQVVRLGPECGAPFRSLEAFARSGLLDKALAASRFNEFAPAGEDVAPMLVRGADLLELWAPFLTVRGDTVRVVGQVSFQDPRTPGSLRVEAVLQRQPESHEVRRFGRRWRVIRVRLL